MRPAALFAGLTTLDVVHLVERLPHSNEKLASADFLVAAGGPATNAAVAFARCGGAAELITALPDDALAGLVAADLARCGVRLSVEDALEPPTPTASILVTRETGDRAVVSPTGRAGLDLPAAVRLDDPARLADSGAVLLDGYFRHLGLPLAWAARRAGVPVILDAGSFKRYTEELIAVTDLAIVSDDFAVPDTDGSADAVLEWLLAHGVRAAVVTRGGAPLVWRTVTARGEVAVDPVAVVDTLGAGDVFHGAMTFRIASLGLDLDRLPQDLEWSARVAGASLRSFGTRAWLDQPVPGVD